MPLHFLVRDGSSLGLWRLKGFAKAEEGGGSESSGLANLHFKQGLGCLPPLCWPFSIGEEKRAWKTTLLVGKFGSFSLSNIISSLRNGFVSCFFLSLHFQPLPPTSTELRVVAQSRVLGHEDCVVDPAAFFFSPSSFCARIMGTSIVLSVTKNKQVKA